MLGPLLGKSLGTTYWENWEPTWYSTRPDTGLCQGRTRDWEVGGHWEMPQDALGDALGHTGNPLGARALGPLSDGAQVPGGKELGSCSGMTGDALGRELRAALGQHSGLHSHWG
jgi:hypothetical protein